MPGRAVRPAPTTRPARTTRPAPTSDPAETRSVWKRLGWMLLIWSASVAALGALSLILRLWLKR
jgi:hypothetical protein